MLIPLPTMISRLNCYASSMLEILSTALLPLAHIQVHSSTGPWASYCSTCRSANQRRKAARRSSGPYHADAPIKHAQFGHELWLDPLDYKSSSAPVGQYRYDLAGWDAGTGWRCLPLRNQKTSSIVSTLKAYRRHHEMIDEIVADKANELIQAAKGENADALPLVS